MTQEKNQQLKSCVLFQDLPEETIEKLSTHFAEAYFKDGEILCRENDPANDFFVILEGSVAVLKGYQDAEHPGKQLSLLEHGDSLGEGAFYADRPRSATAVAKGSSKVLRLSRNSFHQFLKEDPAAAQSVLMNASGILFDRLEHTSHELAVIHEIGKLLILTPPLEDLAKELVQRLLAFVPKADEAGLYLWNPYSEEYEPLSMQNREGPLSAPSLPKNHPLIAAFEEKKGTVLTHQQMGTFAVHILSVPLVEGHRIIGCLALTKKAQPFEMEHRNLLEAVAGMLVGAVLNAWARQEEESRRRLHRARVEAEFL